MLRTKLLKGLAACGFGMLVFIGTAAAQVRNFDIPQGDLKSALDAYSRQAGMQVIYRVEDVRGATTAGAHGALDAMAALNTLLAKTGFGVSRDSSGAIAIVKTPPPPSAKAGGKDATSAPDRGGDAGKTLETINVTAKAEGLAAMRVPTELREIPQSVSVISQELLQQQNAFDLVSALNWATGITTIGGGMNPTFASRGFLVSGYHVDGGAQIGTNLDAGIDDLTEYDHIEILRGADGLFGGAGDPGGTFNLVRKQPLATNQASLSATLGSWDYYHLGLDATGPLGFDGALRGRVATGSTDQNFFYDGASRQANKIYGVLADDLSPSTTLTVGGSVEQSNSTDMQGGLPRYTTSSDAHLPRSLGLIFAGSRDHYHMTEAFALLDQHFGEDWRLKAGITRLTSAQNASDASLGGSGIDPSTGLFNGSPTSYSYMSSTSRTSLDATLTGGFDWNGRRQDVTLGMDYARNHTVLLGAYGSVAGPPIDPWHFDPTAYTLLPAGPTSPVYRIGSDSELTTIGAYAALRLRPWDGWSITLGGRDNYQKSGVTPTALVVDVGAGGGPPSWLQKTTNITGGVMTPYAGVVYDINKEYSLYASYADVYQPITQLHLTSAGELFPAVQGINAETGIKAAWDDGRLNGSLALFKIHQDDLALFDPSHPFSQQGNAICCFIPGTNTSKGVESELSGHLGENWLWSAGYTFNISHTATLTGVAPPLLSRAPKHLLKLWTNYQLPGAGQRWSIGGGLQAQTANYVVGYVCSSGGCGPVNVVQGFYTVITLRTAYQLSDHWAVALNINNLLDRTYYQTIGTPGSGNWYGKPRSFMLTLNGKL